MWWTLVTPQEDFYNLFVNLRRINFRNITENKPTTAMTDPPWDGGLLAQRETGIASLVHKQSHRVMTRADEPVGAGRAVMVESPGLVIDDEYPLSPLQQGMLFHSLDRNQPGVDLEQVLCSLSEPLDVPQLLSAWDTVVSRYDILRTSFQWEGRPEPVQNGSPIGLPPVPRHRLAARGRRTSSVSA